MSEEFGPDFVTITDEDGNDIELELLDTIEYNGSQYMAFFPAEEANEDGTEPETEDDEEEDGLIILKVIVENGEEILSTLEDEDELEAVYEQFMEILFNEDDEEEDETEKSED
ncbi:MAG: DUF1292 domain-containing protein [Oscillospiraceae bacterium]